MRLPYLKLGLAIIAHSVLATANNFFGSCMNLPESVMRDFVARSVHAHFNIVLTSSELSWLWSAITAALNLTATLSGIPLVFMAEKCGRRSLCMIWNNLILMTGCIMQIISQPLLSVELLLFGRLVSGISIGWGNFISIYLAECSPDFCRGLSSAAVNVGIMFWYFMGNLVPALLIYFNIQEHWCLMYFVPLAAALVHICLTPFIPESPKYLYIYERKEKEAIESVHFYYGPKTDVDGVLGEFMAEFHLAEAEACHSASLKEILQTPHLRWPLIIVIVANLVPALVGFDIISQYTAILLTDLGLSEKDTALALVLISATQVPIAAVAVPAIEKLGRRPVFLLSSFLGVVGMSLMMISGFLVAKSLAIGGIFVGTFAFCSGALICLFLPGEICPQGSRAISSGFGVVFNYILSVFISLFFLEIENAIGPYSYLPIVIAGLLVFIFLCKHLPESKGKAVDEIVSQWVEKSKDSDSEGHGKS